MRMDKATRTNRILPWLRLVRVPNVFTAMADILMGYLFTHHRLDFGWGLAALLVSSAALYMAGMVWNDVWDYRRDCVSRPERPLPAGLIAPGAARWFGVLLIVVGVAVAWLAGLGALRPAVPIWRSGAVATVLALMILAYDGGLKRTPIGPVAMGACRSLNVLLGMSLGRFDTALVGTFGYDQAALMVALAIGTYVTGITWFARHEHRDSSRWQLGAACVVMGAGLTVLAVLYRRAPLLLYRGNVSEDMWLLMILVIGFTVIRRCSRAVADPTPDKVQAAVTSGIWSLIVLDATVSLLVSAPPWSLVVLVLLGPTIVLGQWVRST